MFHSVTLGSFDMFFNVDDHVILHMHKVAYEIACLCIFFACVLIRRFSILSNDLYFHLHEHFLPCF